MSPFLTAIVSAIIAVLTSLIVTYLAQFLKKKGEEELENKRINLKYLNPLRLYLEENYFRIDEILRRINAKDELTIDLLTHVDVDGLSRQEPQWFNGKGCYLISTCYFTGCLFYQFQKVREDLGYLRLGEDDTKLLNLMLKVRLAFLKDVGIFYATQTSIGNDLYLPDKDRVVTYREFCNLLQDSEKKVWFDRLIDFYITTGKGQKLERLENALKAILELSKFLDNVVGGGPSISSRYISEGITPGPLHGENLNRSWSDPTERARVPLYLVIGSVGLVFAHAIPGGLTGGQGFLIGIVIGFVLTGYMAFKAEKHQQSSTYK